MWVLSSWRRPANISHLGRQEAFHGWTIWLGSIYSTIAEPTRLQVELRGSVGLRQRAGMAYACNLCVLPSCRRRSVGRALLAHAEQVQGNHFCLLLQNSRQLSLIMQVALGWGCHVFCLHHDPRNKPAWHLYQSAGYRPALTESPWVAAWRGRLGNRHVLLMKYLKARKHEINLS